jgi:hypothetical protein
METDYPCDELEFAERFGTEENCRAYLEQLRWPDGFVCPRCGHRGGWKIRRQQSQCAACLYAVSVTAGTILQDTHKPLRLWFRTAWYVTGQKYGASALGLQRVLGLGSYVTAWSWLHKLRRAMVQPGRERGEPFGIRSAGGPARFGCFDRWLERAMMLVNVTATPGRKSCFRSRAIPPMWLCLAFIVLPLC